MKIKQTKNSRTYGKKKLHITCCKTPIFRSDYTQVTTLLKRLTIKKKWKHKLPNSVASPIMTMTAAISQPVCSRVYTPPGTKLYATVHTEKRISTSQTNEATSSVRTDGQVVTRSSIIGQIDVVYTANNMPPVCEWQHVIQPHITRFSLQC